MKKSLRKEFLTLRKSLTLGEKASLDKQIYDNFANSNFLANGSFFVYQSFNSEVETKQIISLLLQQNKTVLVPKIINKQMFAVYYSINTQTSSFGIQEPINEKIYTQAPDVALVPMLAATNSGVRLGYGGGYYDKYLQNKQIIKVGVCYNFQITGKLPRQPHDINMDFLLTDKGIVKVEK